MKQVVILIDGQNLFYGLKNLGIREKDIKWNDFFNHLITDEDELVRTYWFRPQKILDSYYTHHNIENQIIYREFPDQFDIYFNGDRSTIPENILERINARIEETESWLASEKSRFSSIEYNYDQLSMKNENIEIVKTGVVKVNPYHRIYIGEKGVDISLAVKMISLSIEKKCDKIILISGDFDYGEAIKYVKNNMTKIHIVRIHKGVPPRNRSVSRDLAVLADKVIDVYESEIKENFLIP